MTTKDFLSAIGIENAPGFEVVNLLKDNPNSFFQEAITSDELCYCWFSFQNQIDLNQLEKQVFKRENPLITGSNLYRPLFLIVTDAVNYYVSTIKKVGFVKLEITELAIIFLDEWKNTIKKITTNDDQNSKTLFKRVDEFIDYSLKKIKLEVLEAEINSVGVSEEESYKSMHAAAVQFGNAMEHSVKHLSSENQDMICLIHHMLFSMVNKEQLKALLLLPGKHLFVNPCYKEKLLLAKPSDYTMFFAKKSMKVWNQDYFIIHSDGTLQNDKLTIKHPAKNLKPGWFELEIDRVKWFLLES